jgi:hypothetical protein
VTVINELERVLVRILTDRAFFEQLRRGDLVERLSGGNYRREEAEELVRTLYDAGIFLDATTDYRAVELS